MYIILSINIGIFLICYRDASGLIFTGIENGIRYSNSKWISLCFNRINALRKGMNWFLFQPGKSGSLVSEVIKSHQMANYIMYVQTDRDIFRLKRSNLRFLYDQIYVGF